MEEIERSAASVEEAIEAALAELGISEQEARIQIIQEPRQGLLGLNSQPAVVRVRSAPAAPSGEDREEQAEAGASFLRGLLESMGLDTEIEVQDSGEVAYVNVWAADEDEDMGILIGKAGHTLDSLQELVRASVQRIVEGRCVVQVDVEDYRKRQRSRIVSKARDVGRRVRKTGRSETMDPMPSFERKVVHDTIAQIGGLETASEGDEPNRRVVVRRSSQ